MTIPELDEHKQDLYRTRAKDITKRRGAIKLIQRLTSVNLARYLKHDTKKKPDFLATFFRQRNSY